MPRRRARSAILKYALFEERDETETAIRILDLYCVLASAIERFDAQILLDPFEKE
jgi:hypothetical protein